MKTNSLCLHKSGFSCLCREIPKLLDGATIGLANNAKPLLENNVTIIVFFAQSWLPYSGIACFTSCFLSARPRRLFSLGKRFFSLL